jgi:hypothetical protein
MEKRYPTPTISLYGFPGGRFFNNRFVQCISIKFPCIPAWWRNERYVNSVWEDIKNIINKYDMETRGYYMKSYDPYKRRNVMSRHGTTYLPNFDQAEKILLEMFGYSIMQSFNRQLIKKRRCIYKTKRRLICFPENDKINVVYRYRLNQTNESECIAKEFKWLFPNEINFTNQDLDWKPDYSKLEIGEERKPALYHCNICGHSDIKENWNWRTPAGFASHHYITNCPKCKAEGSDIFEDLFGKKNKFKPYMKYQDNCIFWF